jgi:hypothetical protein
MARFSTTLIAEPPGQEIPFNCQLANLGVKLRSLALPLLHAIAACRRTTYKKARGIVEKLFLPAVNLVGMKTVPLRKFRNRRIFAQCFERYFRVARHHRNLGDICRFQAI